MRYLLFLSAMMSMSFVGAMQHDGSNIQQESFVTRVWNTLFGSSQKSDTQQCSNCSNGGNGSGAHIQNAYVTQGNLQGGQGGSAGGSPVTIGTLHGNPAAALAPDVLLALEREKTRQIELANKRALDEEHERNRWFNTLVQYWTQQSEKEKKELLGHGTAMLQDHHQFLQQIAKEKGEVALAKERIRQENLPVLLRHDLEKAELGHRHMMEKLKQFGNGLLLFTGDKQRMQTTALAVSGIILGAYASKRGTKIAADYMSSLLMKPSLVTETSRLTLNQCLRHPIATITRRKKKLPELICNRDLQGDIEKYVRAIKGDKEGPPLHALFYGHPGLGKTLLARKIAHELGKDYAIVPGSNIYQFGEDGVKELNKLFNWAKRNNVVVFIDEIDALAPRRFDTTINVSELSRKIQNTLYARTGTENDGFLLLAATNTPQSLDLALISRLGKQIEFTLPDQQTRLKLLHLYFKQYVQSNARLQIEPGIEDAFNVFADAIEGFSGRDIMNLAKTFRVEAYSAENNKVTSDLLESVVKQTIEQRTRLQNYSSKMDAVD